ncbi:hypothetical protein FOL47_010687 [Perkinsus chesapeaki]|uniref:Uncharacterized protein n=1 Tax=Perkinsus chesapeaki TaxID=330153 RepID=A0A7J6MPL6_PERCH|nr:hypothetical protein FOL47_010687 [Perkinsus chesapeaki]
MSLRLEVFYINLNDPNLDLVSIWSSEASDVGEIVPGRFTVISHEPLDARLHYDHSTRGYIMTSFTKSQYLPGFTSHTITVSTHSSDWIHFPIAGSTFCRYGDFGNFVLWDYKTASTPPVIYDCQADAQQDRSLFACPAAFDGTGKIYYVISHKIEGVSDMYKSIRLVRAFIHLPLK